MRNLHLLTNYRRLRDFYMKRWIDGRRDDLRDGLMRLNCRKEVRLLALRDRGWSNIERVVRIANVLRYFLRTDFENLCEH